MSTISTEEHKDQGWDWSKFFLGMASAGVAALVIIFTYLLFPPR